MRLSVLGCAATALLASPATLHVVSALKGVADLDILDPEQVEIPASILEAHEQEPETPRYPKQGPKNKPFLNPGRHSGSVDVRIVNGTIVDSAEAYPFFAHLPDLGCGASLIYEDILLSAAHCESSWQYTFGAYIGGTYRYEGTYRTVTQEVTHPLWNPADATLDYDYMVMKLESSALIDDWDGSETGVQVVPLNLDGEIPATDDTLTTIGMGLLDENDWYPSNYLMEVDVNAVSNDVCYAVFGFDLFVPDIMICTDGDGGGACFGDSGGPLLTQDGYQVGVTSYGPGGCPKDKTDAVYARVSGVQNWIHQQICQLSDNPPDDCEEVPPPPLTGPGAMTIHIMTDNQGDETAFTLKHTQTGTVFWDVPFGNLTSNTLVSAPSDNLPVGNFTLTLLDAGYDGICCYYGRGFFYVTDDNRDQVIYVNDGSFYDEVHVQMYVDNDGNTMFVEDWYYDPPASAPNPGNVPNYPQQVDEAWPGPEPFEASSLFVNVKFDTYPQETTWELSYRNEEDDWDMLEFYDGAEDLVPSDVVSTQFMNLEAGWYRYTIEDSDGDGICCAHRRGWVALTGFLEVTQAVGLVWGNNGEFEDGTAVYFEVNEDGHFLNLALDEEMMDKMMARPQRKKKKREL